MPADLAAVASARRFVLENLPSYGVHAARIRLVKHLENTTFVACSENVEGAEAQRVFVRVHRGGYHAPEAVRGELRLLQELSPSMPNHLIPQPVPRRDGELVTQSDTHLMSVITPVPGRRLRAGHSLGPGHAKRAGRLLRSLHVAGRGLDLADRPRWNADALLGGKAPKGSKFTSDDTSDWREQGTAWIKDWCDVGSPLRQLPDFVNDLAIRVHRLGVDESSRGFIHGDPNPTNLRFGSGQVNAIDFDDCGWGHHAYDLAVLLFWVMLAEGCRGAVREAVLSGYGAPLVGDSHTWARCIDLFVQVRAMVLLRWVLVRPSPPVQRWGAELLPSACRLAEVLERRL